jgi:hypothetical protein
MADFNDDPLARDPEASSVTAGRPGRQLPTSHCPFRAYLVCPPRSPRPVYVKTGVATASQLRPRRWEMRARGSTIRWWTPQARSSP